MKGIQIQNKTLIFYTGNKSDYVIKFWLFHFLIITMMWKRRGGFISKYHSYFSRSAWVFVYPSLGEKKIGFLIIHPSNTHLVVRVYVLHLSILQKWLFHINLPNHRSNFTSSGDTPHSFLLQ